MSTRPVPKFVSLNTEKELINLISISDDSVVILDYHQDWSGPTQAIMPFLNQLWMEIDDCEKRIYLAACTTDVPGSQKLVQSWAGADVKVAAQGCKPLFIVLRQGQAVGSVDGLNTPVLRMLIDLYLPKLQKKTEE